MDAYLAEHTLPNEHDYFDPPRHLKPANVGCTRSCNALYPDRVLNGLLTPCAPCFNTCV